mmetsp:Transcript_13819/g.20589  ORF Transcript_13819/g.20589 Transcript_13819/m.20589 type:complete len:298 (-) Transcript_13819:752-1645(-)
MLTERTSSLVPSRQIFTRQKGKRTVSVTWNFPVGDIIEEGTGLSISLKNMFLGWCLRIFIEDKVVYTGNDKETVFVEEHALNLGVSIGSAPGISFHIAWIYRGLQIQFWFGIGTFLHSNINHHILKYHWRRVVNTTAAVATINILASTKIISIFIKSGHLSGRKFLSRDGIPNHELGAIGGKDIISIALDEVSFINCFYLIVRAKGRFIRCTLTRTSILHGSFYSFHWHCLWNGHIPIRHKDHISIFSHITTHAAHHATASSHMTRKVPLIVKFANGILINSGIGQYLNSFVQILLE